jgi:hypothetical protein
MSRSCSINPATHLGGGQDFGPLCSGTGSPHLVSRYLTPDKTGAVEGGQPFAELLQIMRTGADLDHLHLPCSPKVTTKISLSCAPFDGNLLQIMAWPTYGNMNEHDIRAIYEYLSAIPASEDLRLPVCCTMIVTEARGLAAIRSACID